MKYRASFMLAWLAATGSAWADETIREALQAGENPLSRIEVQLDATEFAAAAAAAERIVDEIENRSNRHDIELAQPLILLGDARLGLADVVGALDAYDRSRLITRVNKGLFTPDQIEVVYREATAYAALGNREVANDRHEYAFNIMLRAYGDDDPRLIPGLFLLADWYGEEHNIFVSRRLLGQAVVLGKRYLPAYDPQTIRALKGLARTFREERFPTGASELRNTNTSSYVRAPGRYQQIQLNNFSPGERALIEVINIEMAKPDASDAEVADAMLELADWYLLFEKYSRAFPLYTRIWELLESDPEGLDAVFKVPTPLYLPLPPPPPTRANSSTTEDGIVELGLTITDRGLVSDLSTLRSEPEGMMEFQVRKATRRARYRPAFVEALPVLTEDVRIEYRFPYKPDAKTAPAT